MPCRLSRFLFSFALLRFLQVLYSACGFSFSASFLGRRDLFIQSSSFVSLLTTSPRMSIPSTSKHMVQWGIVGLGDVTLQKSGPAFYKSRGAELVAVMRRTPGMASAWVEQQNIMNCSGYDNLEQFLKHPGLNAVYVATPPGSHLQVCREVADANLPAYVEKPVGRCAWETQEISRLFEEKGLALYTAYISRAYERTQAVRTLLQQGVVGERVISVTYVLRGMGGARGMQEAPTLPWRLEASQAGGGLIMDVGCHVLDRIDYLLGPLIKVEGKAENRNSPHQDVEDHVQLQAEIGESRWAAIPSVGATVECTWDFSSGESFDELMIEGPEGCLRMVAMSPSLPIEVLDKEGTVIRELTFEAPQHTAQPLVQCITDELLGKEGKSCISRGDNAIRTAKVLDAVLASYYGGRDDEFWLRPETWPGRPNEKGTITRK